MEAWRLARLAHATGREESDDALPLPAPRFEERQHPVVVSARSGEGVADLVGEVEVAHAHGVGVAEGAQLFLPALGAPEWVPKTVALIVVLVIVKPFCSANSWAKVD